MWLYEGKEIDDADIEGYVGFVYLIENETNGRKYIGRKLFTKAKTIQRNKKKKRLRVPSDWKDYVGSNDELKEDANKGHVLKRTILHLCKSKGWCTYLETKEILMRDCLISDQYYNSWVSCKIRHNHLK